MFENIKAAFTSVFGAVAENKGEEVIAEQTKAFNTAIAEAEASVLEAKEEAQNALDAANAATDAVKAEKEQLEADLAAANKNLETEKANVSSLQETLLAEQEAKKGLETEVSDLTAANKVLSDATVEKPVEVETEENKGIPKGLSGRGVYEQIKKSVAGAN